MATTTDRDRDVALVTAAADTPKYTVEFLSLSKQKISAKNNYFIYLNNSEGTFDFYQDSKYFIEYSSKLTQLHRDTQWTISDLLKCFYCPFQFRC